MALCLAESLLDTGGFDAADQLRGYIRWWQYSRLSRLAIRAPRSGTYATNHVSLALARRSLEGLRRSRARLD